MDGTGVGTRAKVASDAGAALSFPVLSGAPESGSSTPESRSPLASSTEEEATVIGDVAPPETAAQRTVNSAAINQSMLTAHTQASREARDREQIDVRRRGLNAVVLVSIGGIAMLLLGVQRGPTFYPLVGALAFLTLAALWTQRRIRTGRIATSGDGMAVAAALVCLAAVAHVGVTSWATMLLLMLVYFSAGLDARFQANLVLFVVGVGFVALVVVVYSGVLPMNAAIIAPLHGKPRGIVVNGTAIGLGLLVAYYLAWQSRKVTREAMDGLQKARLAVDQREAQLEEAQFEVDQAREAGKLGRFSGQSIGGFGLSEVLGRGGMGEVYRARRNQDDDDVAIKVLHAHLQGDEAHLERFWREARVSSSLQSSHIAKILETGRADDGSPFLAMELLSGDDLAKLLRDTGRIPLERVLGIVDDVAAALSVAHAAGIVHRDLKPQNVLASDPSRQHWKVVDFGVSKIMTAETTIAAGSFVGTPSYVSPEQARSGDIDHRADVFSLAVLTYRAITGRPAFRGHDASTALWAIMYKQPERPSDLVTVHEDVDLVLALGLAKRAEDRLDSASLLGEMLRRAASGKLSDSERARARHLVEQRPWGEEHVV